MELVDKHAPLQSKLVSIKHSPWITHELTRKIHKRNYMKKIAIQENNTSAWVRYKQARNEANNGIKSAKKHYLIHNLKLNKKNPRKTWMLIDELSSRKCRRVRNISEIKVDNEPITSVVQMAEVFNDCFANIGSNLASEIQPSSTEPEFYLQPTDTIFSLKAPSASTVCWLLNQPIDRSMCSARTRLCGFGWPRSESISVSHPLVEIVPVVHSFLQLLGLDTGSFLNFCPKVHLSSALRSWCFAVDHLLLQR